MELERDNSNEGNGERDLLQTILGAYHPSSYFRTVYVSYSREEVEKLDRQIKTGKPALTKRDYEMAESWKEKERILNLFITPYHEAFHFFQRLITSYGIYDQYIRTFRSGALLWVLYEKNGLPNRSLKDFVTSDENQYKYKVESPLSLENFLLTALSEEGYPYKSHKARALHGSKMFKVIPVDIGAELKGLPSVYVELNGNVYPFGAKVLKESWAYSFMVGAIRLAFGQDAVSEYVDTAKVPFYPYKVLDSIIHTICGDAKVMENPLFVSYLCSVLAYYGLNHETFDPSNAIIGAGFFPGYRTACLIEMLKDCIKTRRKGEISSGTIFDALDCALLLDQRTDWTPFMINGYSTHDRISAYMSDLTSHGTKHLKTVDLGAHARFVTRSETVILETLSDTAIIYEVQRWLHRYARDTSYRPPVSLFFVEINGKQVPEMRTITDDPDESFFWSLCYVMMSIVEQKWKSPYWKCPLALGGKSACGDYFESAICENQFTSFDLPPRLLEKSCPLVKILQSFKQSNATNVQ